MPYKVNRCSACYSRIGCLTLLREVYFLCLSGVVYKCLFASYMQPGNLLKWHGICNFFTWKKGTVTERAVSQCWGEGGGGSDLKCGFGRGVAGTCWYAYHGTDRGRRGVKGLIWLFFHLYLYLWIFGSLVLEIM